jgi:hypothetical protein
MKRRIFIKQTAFAGVALAIGAVALVPKNDIRDIRIGRIDNVRFIESPHISEELLRELHGVNMLGVSSSGQPYVQIGTGPTPLLKEI